MLAALDRNNIEPHSKLTATILTHRLEISKMAISHEVVPAFRPFGHVLIIFSICLVGLYIYFPQAGQNWFQKLEDITQIKVDSPVPNSVR